jgi:hypothetical protein
MDVLILVVLLGTTSFKVIGLWEVELLRFTMEHPDLTKAIYTAHHLALFLLVAGMVKDRLGPLRANRLGDD